MVYVSNNSTTTIDKVLTLSTYGRWGGGVSDSKRTMERYNSNENIWGTNLALIVNGKDANGNGISGTPKARNSLNYLIATSTILQQDITLTKENSPYFIYDTILVPQGKTLKTEPGVVVKIRGGSTYYLDVQIKSLYFYSITKTNNVNNIIVVHIVNEMPVSY